MTTAFWAEFIGTALLLAIVTGSGIMGDSLSGGNAAVALLGNSIATGAGLYVLITLLGPVSGAHFNPVVSVMARVRQEIDNRSLSAYLLAQFSGAVCGVWATHLMFGQALLQTSTKVRSGPGQWFSEFVANLVLLSVIRLGVRQSPQQVPMLVALVVTAGYWFTSSTFFCNPAVSLARSFTDTFVGIQPADVMGFVLAQMAALLVFLGLSKKFP
jgi:glycerol uptake facilitator-like aquaporin